ncbi:rho guanine nucleotide exchange factor 17-like isoform X2 [Homarus americanus]|uniref:rho guanine nucleotide exchange factor 17-like isoform X2 n=1 Tax=Homarus americanus TaxID=6706 RepID=UPI001C43E741|nr:rho guanine nucleotide exchange factor 17-like isoform X2 [Homarus americanus]
MEGRAGGTTTLPRNKGATLPGFRVGSVRYGVRLAPHNGSGAPLPPRRCSEGDLGAPGRGSTRVEGVKVVARDGSGPDSLQPLVNNGPAAPGTHLTPSDHTPRSLGSSPLHLKEAHSLLNNRWAPLTVPTASSLLPPASPRPHALRRSFNSSPRPWVAPSTQVDYTTTTEDADDRGGDNNNDKKSGVGGRWRTAPTDGAGVHPDTDSQTDPLKLSPHPPEAGGSPSLRGGPRPAPPLNPPVDVATFRSEATILVTQTSKGQGKRATGQGERSSICRRRGVGTLSLARTAGEDGEGVGGPLGAGAGVFALLEEVRAGGLPPPVAKYTCCVAGRSPRHLLPRHATMFSYPGPARPTIPEEPASAHLASDQCSAPPPATPSHAHGSAVQCTVFPGGEGGSVASGGSGHGDRVAPPAPVTGQQGSPTTTPARRTVRPRPEIPDHLYRRWAALLPSDAGLDYRKQRQQAEVGAGAPGGAPGPSDEVPRPVTSPDLSPAAGGTQRSQDNQLEPHLQLSSQQFARFRLGLPTGGLGGGRKEGGRGPPPARPPRSRQNHLEELRKCTERLKTPSPDKKVRADSAPPPDTTASAASDDGDSVPPRGKTKKGSNDTRSVLTRHPSLGKSPSLPPQLPSSKDPEVFRLSPIPVSRDPREAPPPDGRREEEDVFQEGVVKPPPRPRPDSRLVIPPRFIPFRSASVSQVDVASDSSFFQRSGKSPTAILLYPRCKDYSGSNTLPKRRPAVATKEGGGAAGGPNHHHHHHPPLTTAASISDMTNVGAKSGLSQPDKLENKSKSESELSVAGLGGEGGLAGLRDNLLGKKVDTIDASATSGGGARGAGGPKEGTEDAKGKEHIAKDTRAAGGQGISADKQVKTNDSKTEIMDELNSEKNREDKEHSELRKKSKENVERKGERKDKEGNKSNRVSFSDEVKNFSVDPEGDRDVTLDQSRSLVCVQHSARGEVPINSQSNTDKGNAESEAQRRSCGVLESVVFTLGDEDEGQNSVRGSQMWEVAPPSRHHRQSDAHEGKDSKSGAETPRGDAPGPEMGAAGDFIATEAAPGTTGPEDSRVSTVSRETTPLITEVIKDLSKGEVGDTPPGGEKPSSGGLVPPAQTPEPAVVPLDCVPDEVPLPSCTSPRSSTDTRLSSELVSTKVKTGGAESGVSQCTDHRQVECQVLQKEPRLSQCLVIKSGARESGEHNTLGGEGATSECRVVRSRPRLPREDSDGDSGEREASRMYLTQISDEGIFEEESKSHEPRDSSDSSSQDSVGVGQDRSDEGIIPGSVPREDVPVRTGSRRRRKLDEDNERSLTFPPPRKGSHVDSIGYSSVDSNGLRSLVASGAYGDRVSGEQQRSSFSLPGSYMSETNQPPDTRQLLLITETRPMDRAERKKKHHSDPSCERRGSTDALLYLSEPHLGNVASQEDTGRGSNKGVVSQASTDSEGRDERGDQMSIGPLRVCTPQVLLGDHESDGSDYPPCRTPARNASPIPYLQDSDSGERSAPRSPHGPRRYFKRPLRGPYGLMLEAEMNKSKSSATYLAEGNYLRVRDAKSCSPRPPSPASPSVMVEEGERPPLIIPTARSRDDSAIRINYASSPDNPVHRKESEETETGPTSPVGPVWEMDGEGSLSPLPIGPVHQRTASSPSKLFPGGGFTSDEEQELVDYYSARLLGQNSQQRQLQHRQQQQQDQQPQAPQQAGSELRHPTPYEHRHTSDHRHSHKRHRDTRAHVVGELHDTERNYVNNLNFLLTRYQQTLKSPEYSAIIDASLVDDIFYQVPDIHTYHERFLEELKQRIESRDASNCVGDIFLQLVNDPGVLESYTSFTNNWKTAHEAAKAAAQAKPAFRHFLVARAREHHGKLDLKALLIKPVQRLPQYELLLKRLLKHTSREHPDHALLTEAIGVVQQLASRINAVEQEALQHEQQQLLLKELENIIEGLDGLVQPDRMFLRHDLVTMHPGLVTRKERCLFLFSDLLVITAIKRRSGTIRKGSSLPFTLLSSLEANKFKLFKFIPLDELDIARSRDESVKKLVRELETLQEDLQTLEHISKLTKTLRCPRGPMEDSVQDMITQVQKQLAERHGADSQLMELELTITTQEGMENLTFMFSSAEKRAMWEEAFNDAKHKLAMSADRRPPPEFVSALPIRKTRAGLQFTCATATLGLNAHNLKDVWVCNSDGYVGQVCVLSLQPDPTVACCNGVCNARILSIASIPAAPQPDSSDDDEDEEIPMDEDIRKRRSESLPPEMSSDDTDNQQPTMWLGTEDGFIHVYNCSDTIRIKKNKFKFQPGSPVHCIIHLDNRVFASLANGDIIVYRRDQSGGWNVADRQVISISTAAAPVTRMMAVAGKLWCAAMNTVRVLNTVSLQVEHSFVVGGENGRGVSCMVSAGHGVWVSVHNSAAVRLYHAATYECLCEVNVAPAVTKMLAGCDDIIRQHKAACLRVTSLLACKDLLWVGTSAGVIITVPLPHLAHNTHRVQAPLNMVGIPYGHTGHVRFLTSVELTPEPRTSRLKGHSRYSFKGRDHPHHQPGTAAPAKLLVISGGDGYEDFRSSGMSELAGRDDSTNHLLLWQV